VIRRALMLLLFCFFATLAAAQTNSIFRIHINASGDNAAEVEGYLKKALQSLGDVEMIDDVDTKPTYTIQVAVLQTATAARVPTGFALSFLAEFHGAERWVNLEDHQLVIAGTDSLKGKCEEYISRINPKVFEPHRKIFQEVKKALAR
jgi:hypothetical protein